MYIWLIYSLSTLHSVIIFYRLTSKIGRVLFKFFITGTFEGSLNNKSYIGYVDRSGI